MRVVLLSIAVLGLALGSASADGCTPTTSTAVAVGGFYVSEDCYLDPILEGRDPYCLVIFSLWVYEEANGLPGLQRQDEVVDDTCQGAIPGDRIIL